MLWFWELLVDNLSHGALVEAGINLRWARQATIEELCFPSSWLISVVIGPLEAIYMEIHFTCHEKISLWCQPKALMAFTWKSQYEVLWWFLLHVGYFDISWNFMSRVQVTCKQANMKWGFIYTWSQSIFE